MEHLKISEGEYRLACIVWDHEPLPSGKLVELAGEQLGWKKSTTYTVLKKLVERGILKNENATVTALVKREQVRQYESAAVVERGFGGSLPAFVAAFLKGNKLSPEEAEELRRMIDESGARHD